MFAALAGLFHFVAGLLQLPGLSRFFAQNENAVAASCRPHEFLSINTEKRSHGAVGDTSHFEILAAFGGPL